jgi:hypothetical protein
MIITIKNDSSDQTLHDSAFINYSRNILETIDEWTDGDVWVHARIFSGIIATRYRYKRSVRGKCIQPTNIGFEHRKIVIHHRWCCSRDIYARGTGFRFNRKPLKIWKTSKINSEQNRHNIARRWPDFVSSIRTLYWVVIHWVGYYFWYIFWILFDQITNIN